MGMLEFDPAWRFRNPQNDDLHHGILPDDAVDDLMQLIRTAAAGPQRKALYEHFARAFAAIANKNYWSSSTTAFAEGDCMQYLLESAERAPLCIEGFYDAWNEVLRSGQIRTPPIDGLLNEIFARRGIGYRVVPPNLEVLGAPPPLVEVHPPELTLGEQAQRLIRASLTSANTHLERGDDRAAVMESLWLLDSVTTVFQGVQLPEGAIHGAYFNQIVGDLRRSQHLDRTFQQVLRWMETMYGYLSAPNGGQIRHGMNLSDEIRLTPNDARLYCNLIRSYIEYLLAEHQRLTIQ